MFVAEPWFSSPAALFGATVALVALGIVAAVIALLSWRSQATRGHLLVSLTSRTRLFTAPQPMRDELEVRYQGDQLRDPYVATVEFTNVGRAAIHSESFDRDRGIVVELDAPVIKVLTTEHQPSSAPHPHIIASTPTLLELKPELIVGRESITTSLLTEGPVKKVKLNLNPLGDVTVEIRDQAAWEKQRRKRSTITTVAIGGLLVVVATTLGVLLSQPFGQPSVRVESTSRSPSPTFRPRGSAFQFGPPIKFGEWVTVSCKLYNPSSPDYYFYRISAAPWDNEYYTISNDLMTISPIYSRLLSHLPDCTTLKPK
jgi:hypothetical protein